MSRDVRFWEIRPNKSSKRKKTYEVRWKVGRRAKSRTFETKALAKNFLLDLQLAAKRGEEFSVESGLPESMLKAKRAVTWLDFSVAYVDMKWPYAAPNSRDGLTETLATVAPVLVRDDAPEAPDAKIMRTALRAYYLAPKDRERPRPVEIADALAWLEKASLPLRFSQ